VSDVQDKKQFVEELSDQGDDFSRWYNEVVRKAQLADYSPVRGCMVIRPYGYGIWELIQQHLDRRIKATGHQNAYFPLLIPESLLKLEAEHVEGFAPQVAWVTQGGNEELEERLCVRPTSETMVCKMYSRWIESYRDLPLLINQWCNVMRWEKVTRLFLRTAEFLWQEGHTAHATAAEAREEVLRMLHVYRDFAQEDLAIPVHAGRKSESEKFPGAVETYSIEALMRDGKGLQAGTSHDLGQHFAKVFDITYQDPAGARQHVHQTSWGVTTRMIGALIMTHGDDQGLRLPPRVAPIQAVVVPIWRKEEEKTRVRAFVGRVREALGDRVRLHVDDRDHYSPGWKYNEYELRGVPIRLEVGPRDVAQESVMTVRRDTRAKEAVALGALAERLPRMLDDIQAELYRSALEFREQSTQDVRTLAEMESDAPKVRGFVRAHWCGRAECEATVKARTMATLRCIPEDFPAEPGPCLVCGETGPQRVLFAKAY
jgi:prolyl-tRNA synthetase